MNWCEVWKLEILSNLAVGGRSTFLTDSLEKKKIRLLLRPITTLHFHRSHDPVRLVH